VDLHSNHVPCQTVRERVFSTGAFRLISQTFSVVMMTVKIEDSCVVLNLVDEGNAHTGVRQSGKGDLRDGLVWSGLGGNSWMLAARLFIR